jgi:DNA-binding NarL/FixJ family response regulator
MVPGGRTQQVPNGKTVEALRLVVITNRASIVSLFSLLPFNHALTVEHVNARALEVANRSTSVMKADALVVDGSSDPLEAIEICRELQRIDPHLAVAVFLCCSSGVTTWHLQEIGRTGVRGIFDLYQTAEDVCRSLVSLARGEAVLHLQGPGVYGSLLPSILGNEHSEQEAVRVRSNDANVLDKLVQGFSDREIGARLNLSPHTIKHHIERLREAVGARNRIELAAWAGRYGFHKTLQ